MPHRDLALSLRNLRLLVDCHRLEPAAQQAVAERQRKRANASLAVSRGQFQIEHGVAFAVLDESIDGEFFPALLPDVSVILMASPRPKVEEGWNIKLRLGNAAPDGFNLQTLKIEEFDPKYGGRWNAGSNKRGGGTRLGPEEYARQIVERFKPFVRRS